MSRLLRSFLIGLAIVDFLIVAGIFKTGEFYLLIESVDNHPQASREFADWHFSLRRINKTVRAIEGYFDVKKELIRPWIKAEAYLYTMNKFVKININGPMQGTCEDLLHSIALVYFEGNITYTDDCVIKSGYMVTRKNMTINPDEIAHTIYSKAFYKKFKVITTMYNEAGDAIMVASWVASTKEKE